MADTDYLDCIAALSSGLKSALESLRAEWAPEPPPLTIAAGSLANALVGNFANIPACSIQAILDLCEQALANGSAAEQAALATGFLEALQHADGRGQFDFRAIASVMGRASKEHCQRMDRFYGATTKGL